MLTKQTGNAPQHAATAPLVLSAPRRSLLGVWRILNTFILVVGFLGPQLQGCNVTTNGQPAAPIAGWMAVLVIATSPYGNPLAKALVIGAVCIALYLVLNTNKAVTPERGYWAPLALRLAVAGSVGLLFATLATGLSSLSALLWGYWLTWAGLVSALSAEALD